MRAAADGKTECVQLLLSAGADITVQDTVSNILLSFAVLYVLICAIIMIILCF